ncbi:hypothetical protein GW17_00010018 [Ensete ventricosum]|nr:hypothetical protein GW17_00010018 [Ensete ventricosum]
MPQDSRGASALWDFDFKYDDLNVVRRRTASDIGALETSSSCKEEQPEVSDPIAMDSAVDLVAKTESDGGHSPDAAPRTNHHAEDGASPPPPPPPPGPPSTTETVKNVLKRWGKKVGETAKKAEDFSINTWQHREYCKF